MKKIVRGNDFTLRIPVKKIVNGEQVSFPLTDCTNIAVHVVSQYKRTAIVDNNASSDIIFEGGTTEGDTNIEDGNGDNANKGCMDVKIEGFAVDTALVVLPPVSARTTPSVKKSKPKIEYVVGRAIKCSLLTCSSSDRVRYIVPSCSKMLSLLVGNSKRSLMAKKGDSIKVELITDTGFPLGGRDPIRTHFYDVLLGRNGEIEITKATNDFTCYRVSLYLTDLAPGAWFVKNVTLSKDGVYVVTLDSKGIPSSFDTVSPYRKFEKGMVVNKRLPQSLDFNAGALHESSAKQAIYTYKYTWCRTKRLKKVCV